MQVQDHLILRLPQQWVRFLDENANLEIHPVKLEGEDHQRTFRVLLNDMESIGFLLDLPCIIETHKTLDAINFFKASDLSQMLYVVPQYEKQEPRKRHSSLQSMLIKGEMYKAKSGITPGTHDITSRFFKGQSRQDSQEVKKVENYIKSVMENGSALLVEEELIELDEGQPTPENTEEIIAIEDQMDLDH